MTWDARTRHTRKRVQGISGKDTGKCLKIVGWTLIRGAISALFRESGCVMYLMHKLWTSAQLPCSTNIRTPFQTGRIDSSDPFWGLETAVLVHVASTSRHLQYEYIYTARYSTKNPQTAAKCTCDAILTEIGTLIPWLFSPSLNPLLPLGHLHTPRIHSIYHHLIHLPRSHLYAR